MAALDFPAAPVNGQVFTGVGGINWVWDGAKWNPGTSLSAGQFVPLAGGTMTGPLILSGPPTQPLQAATKTYVDGFLPLTGGTLTGDVTIRPASGSANLILRKGSGATNAITGTNNAGLNRWQVLFGDNLGETGGNSGNNFVINRHDDAGAFIDQPLTIDRRTGFVNIAGSPQNNVGRNLIHNPLFNIAQRGAGPWTANGAYTADRWVQWFVNGTVSTQINGIGSPIPVSSVGDDVMQRVLYTVFTGGAAAGDLAILQHPIEGVQRLGGKTVTLSFWAATNGANLKIGANFEQNFGTGGSPSTAIQGTGQSITANTTYTRYSMTFNIPSVSGKTLGTAGNDCTKLNFWVSAGTNNATSSGSVGVQSGGIAFWGVQLEIGSTMTPLEKPDPRYDLANCQRFYQTGYANLSGQAPAGAGIGYFVPFVTTMRAAPTVFLANPSYINANSLAASAVQTVGAMIQAAGTAAGPYVWSCGLLMSADL